MRTTLLLRPSTRSRDTLRREDRREDIRHLDRQIRALEHHRLEHHRRHEEPDTGVATGCIVTGWGPVLPRGAVHEWFVAPSGAGEAISEPLFASLDSPHPSLVSPHESMKRHPLCLFAHLAAAAIEGGEGAILWVGKRCWPHPRVLVRDAGTHPLTLRRSLFIDPPDAATRLWAIDAALRSPGTAAVIADGRGFDMAATRRLQLAAEADGRAIALIARPAAERTRLSAATTRWRVEPLSSDEGGGRPRWRITLERWKGRGNDATGIYEVEWNDETGALCALSGLGDRSGSTATT